MQKSARKGREEPLNIIDATEILLPDLQRPLIEQMRTMLRVLFENGIPDNLTQDEVCERVNTMAKNYGLRLLYNGEPMTIRVNKESFEARTATKRSRTRYKRRKWPLLDVGQRSAYPDTQRN